MEIKPLFVIQQQKDSSSLADFSCGIDEMDDFIHRDLDKDITNRHCTLYTVHNPDGVIVAMFALSFDSLVLSEGDLDDMNCGVGTPSFTSEEHKERFMQQLRYPAMDIAYLAVRKECQRQKYGTNIIREIINHIKEQNLGGCQFITVDAYDTKMHSAVRFYERCEFYRAERQDASPNTIRMYYAIQY